MSTQTTRRDFIKYLALIAAGAAALPQQIEAFEKYYEANTPFGDELVAIDEVFLSGVATKSTPIWFELYRNDRMVSKWGMNTFGGILRWTAMPDQKIIASRPDIFWRITAPKHFDLAEFSGQISYVDGSYKRRLVNMQSLTGSLADL